MKILLVDDNADFRLSVREMLKLTTLATAEIYEADSLVNATALLGQYGADVVLLDLNLTDSNGFETFRRMRAVTDKPIIVMSGSGDPELSALVLGSRSCDYFPKDGNMTPVNMVRIINFHVARHEFEQKWLNDDQANQATNK